MAEVAEGWFKRVFRSKWFHGVLQIITIALCGWWWFVVPAPGKAVLALTIVAVIMTIESLTGRQRAIWLVLIFALAFVENRAINRDRQKFADDEAGRRENENKQFSKIGDSIKTNVQNLLDHSDQQFHQTVTKQSSQFAATMRKTQTNIDEITGGDSYVIVHPDFTPRKEAGFPLVAKLCRRCLYTVAARIYEPEPRGLSLGSPIFEGDIIPRSGVTLQRTIIPSATTETTYTIVVLARNKPTYETLKVRFNTSAQQWECSWHIEREEKLAHFNSKTKMAEGEVRKVLEDGPWIYFGLTPINPATVIVIPKQP